ncbi:hypothetical protein BGO17_03565 [Candidatus Saccharibacteria bacterium 49-20]|nr:MAG: hypothetical protein BGO17_03565 [Candidatus Saccharibacteria bacterium 49-20]
MAVKSQKTKSKISKSTLITAGIIVGTYLVGTYLGFTQHIVMFLWMAVSGLTAGFASSGANAASAVVSVAMQVLAILIPGVIVGFVLAVCKRQYAFRVGFMATLIAAFITPIVSIYTLSDVMRFVVQFAVIVGAAFAALGIVKYVKKPLLGVLIVGGLVALNVFALQPALHALSRPISEAKQASELERAVSDIVFTPYHPTYIPSGLEATPAKLEGYHSTAYDHKRVTYKVGKVEFMVSEKLKNQDSLFNKTNNCDVSSIWFEMRTKDEVSQSRVERSLNNLSVCQVLGTTEGGVPIYIEAGKSQFEFYYMELDGTIIVAQHDTLPKPRYGEDFKNEMLKVYNGMRKVSVDELQVGY